MSYRLPRLPSLALALAGLLFTLAATPADAEPTRRVTKACTADAKRLCPREKPNSAEMEYCMEAKGKQLSRNCIRALEDEGTIPRGYFGKT